MELCRVVPLKEEGLLNDVWLDTQNLICLFIDLKDNQSFRNTKVFLFEDSLTKLLFKKMDRVVP